MQQGMSEDDKPFVCTAPNCAQRFTNEDHLTVHMKKHDMTLALSQTTPSSQHPLFLDQTPTPTKFLRTCEEIGLFQELSKNPFDEAFKKASDNPSDNHEAAPLPGPDSNSSKLDTPMIQLSPHPAHQYTRPLSKLAAADGVEVVCKKRRIPQHQVGDVTSTGTRRVVTPTPVPSSNLVTNLPTSTTPDEPEIMYITSCDPADSTTPTTDAPRPAVITELGVASSTTSPVPHRVIPSAPITMIRATPQVTMPMQILLQLPTGQTVPLNIPTTIAAQPSLSAIPVTVLKKMVAPPVMTAIPTPQSLTKQKLKAVLQNSQKLSTCALSREESESDEDGMDLHESYMQTSPEYNGKLGEESEDRRRRFLERNRAAAARCRNKRKMWITGLERKADELQNTNQKLQNEVSQLRSEVSELKLLLMAHKDCPITLQQKSQGQIPLSNLSSNETVNSQPRPVTTVNLTSEEAIASVALTKMSEGINRVEPVQMFRTICDNTAQIGGGIFTTEQTPFQLVVTATTTEELSEVLLQQNVRIVSAGAGRHAGVDPTRVRLAAAPGPIVFPGAQENGGGQMDVVKGAYKMSSTSSKTKRVAPYAMPGVACLGDDAPGGGYRNHVIDATDSDFDLVQRFNPLDLDLPAFRSGQSGDLDREGSSLEGEIARDERLTFAPPQSLSYNMFRIDSETHVDLTGDSDELTDRPCGLSPVGLGFAPDDK